MKDQLKQVVSLLASLEKITLFTALGEVLDMPNDGPYDTTRLVEDISPKLDGKTIVEVDLNNYLSMSKAIIPDGFEDTGIVMRTTMNGVEVEGIFYPAKVQVAVQHEGRDVIIPNVEKLENHANRAASENSPSVRNFLRRLAPVVESRLHSAEDLMSFIEKSELPLTDDGLIIAYKKVNRKQNGYFVDVHSGQIEQKVGSHVWMDVDAVDPSRNQSCSHGLHVANLGYLKGFNGTHTLIVLVDPANFIAVPHGETNKARVCAYDVIGVMTSGAKELVDSGEFVKGDQTFSSLISDAIAGKREKMVEAVKVGTKEVLSRQVIVGGEVVNPMLEEAKRIAAPSGESLRTDVKPVRETDAAHKAAQGGKTRPWFNAPEVVITAFEYLRKGMSKADAARETNTSTRSLGRWLEKFNYDGWLSDNVTEMTVSERARAYYDAGDFDGLKKFRRSKKKSLSALGFTDAEIAQIEA